MCEISLIQNTDSQQWARLISWLICSSRIIISLLNEFISGMEKGHNSRKESV